MTSNDQGLPTDEGRPNGERNVLTQLSEVKPWAIAAFFLIFVLVVGSVHFLEDGRVPSTQTIESRVHKPLPANASNKDAAATSAVNEKSEKISSAPLPPRNTPLVSIYDSLKDRVLNGDAVAGCRLSLELRRCWIYEQRKSSLEALISHAASVPSTSAGGKQAIASAAEAERQLEASQAVCNGVANVHYDAYFETLLRTAQLGHPVAQVEFATTGGFFEMEYVRNPERLAQWASIAPGLVQDALESGSPEAAFAMYMARTQDVGLLEALIPNDPVEAEALGLLLNRVLILQRQLPSHGLSPLQQAEAQSRALTMYKNNFATRGKVNALRSSEDVLDPDLSQCDLQPRS